MKPFYLLVASLLIGTGCGGTASKVTVATPVPRNTFSFVYWEYFHETSKDTHSHRTSFALKNGKLVYDYTCSGLPAPGNTHKELSMNDGTIEQFRGKLKELNLFINYAKNIPVAQREMINTGKTLYLTDGERSYKITIAGGLDIKDKVSDRLSEFRSFIRKYFKN